MSGKFELKKSANGQYYFNLKSSNGQIILSSEMYKAKASALNGIESIRKNCKTDGRYGPKAMENGIASVKKNAKKAKIEEK